ncbi:CaiB/BaiF CoA transferase family protein [Bartonella sp. HY761]|uniref:CaiB/BaiF CoA transferase family protein n=1 Tax=Bartonella sp. HY761 TaxID=2979330 RepID=UPI002203268F|nr:CoA transferase [Bartonella sp. HY761]UXN06909.1 CoA transferase [Bartonella sp. HY761]
MGEDNKAPLDGIRVVELARVLAGPWIGQTLADLGACVIKVESLEGDDTRKWGPPFVERQNINGDIDKTAAYFYSANRGKESILCDFNDDQQLAKLKELINDADILVENFKHDGLKKYGLDHASLSVNNPRLIYASVTGFGQNGPRANQPGYDFLIQGMSGIMDLTGDPKGEPQKVGVAWIDIFTGLYGVIAIQAALYERLTSGKGQHIDLALFDVAVAMLANQASNYLYSGKVPHRLGNTHPNIMPYQVFPAKDGFVIITCGNDRQFASLCQSLQLNQLVGDPLYENNGKRLENSKKLTESLSEKTAQKTRAELIDLMGKVGVPCGPINTVEDAINDQQIKARNLKIEVEGFPLLRSPIIFSRSPMVYEKAPPVLGSINWQSAKWPNAATVTPMLCREEINNLKIECNKEE